MRDYRRALKTIGTGDAIRASVLRAKERLEALLRPLMARTERALVHKEDLFDRDNPQVSVETQDLVVFKHFAETAGAEFAGWAPAMWTSIPYPAQTMHGYKIWKSLQAAKPAPIEAGSGKGNLAHPQLRHLAHLVGDNAHLSLPWQPPTVAWWRLEGPWSGRRPLPGKTLLFSRWRGAPTAISALLSINLSGGLRKPKEKAPVALLRPGGSETGALVGLFMPWPSLPLAIEPRKSRGTTLASVRADARRQLEVYLQARRIRLDGTEKRPTWIVAAGIEREINGTTYQRVSSLADRVSRGAKAKNWSSLPKINRVSPAEVAALSDHLLSSPGSILARCLVRHDVPQDRPRDLAGAHLFAGHFRGHFGHFLVESTARLWALDHIREPLDSILYLPYRGAVGAIERAIAGELDAWRDSPEGALALILLCDQFTRNCFRKTAQAFAGDARAIEMARHALARFYPSVFPVDMRLFFYMPFGHSEQLADQQLACVLFETIGGENNIKSAPTHYVGEGDRPVEEAVVSR